MNFYIDSGGTIIATDPEQVYQGSAMANTIRLIAPFPLGASVTVSYTLPDGTQMQPQLMTANKTLSGVQTETGVNFSVWEQNIGVRFEQVNGAAKAVPDFTVLSQVGKVGVVFTITQANASGQPIKQTTARSSFLCERGAPLEMPTEAFDDYKSLLNQILGQLSVAVQNDIYLEQAIQDVEDSIEEVDQKYEQSVTELEDGKVNRAGDTMTGPLKVEDTSTAGPESTDYTAQGVEIIDEHNRDYTSYRKDSIRRIIADGDEFEIKLPTVRSKLATESQIQDAEERISSAIDGIREDIRNEAHFRGYVATNAEIQALKADDNDYAYSAESGTVWIYQGNAWTNSGKPVPGQSTPASNSTPLMDGKASVGKAEAYARGDHVHPTDTTLAKTIDGEVMYDGIEKKNTLILRLYNSNNELIKTLSIGLPQSSGGGGGEGGTIVTIDGIAQETWDADTKVDKVTSTDGTNKVYVAAANGGQTTLAVTSTVSNNAIAQRRGDGTIFVPSNTALGNAAISKYQADNSYVLVITNTYVENVFRVYSVDNQGNQQIIRTTDNTNVLSSKKYVDDNFVVKVSNDTGNYRLYAAKPLNEGDTTLIAEYEPHPGAITICGSASTTGRTEPTGTIPVITPQLPYAAANKAYVDNAIFGQEAGNYSSLDEMIAAITGDEYGDLYSFLDYLWQNRNN